MVVAKIRHNYHPFSKINRNGVKLFENFVAMETKSNDSINTTSLTTSQDKYEPTKIHSKKKNGIVSSRLFWSFEKRMAIALFLIDTMKILN